MNKPHIVLAQKLWKEHVSETSLAIDATAGNGHDTLYIASLLTYGKLFSFDIQELALKNTKDKLQTAGLLSRAELLLSSHHNFPATFEKESFDLIVYNLGYLPGGDKDLTTMTHSTIESIQKALQLLSPRGLLSITLYPGHPEGEKEKKAILEYAKTLSSQRWNVEHIQWINRDKAPELLLIKKC